MDAESRLKELGLHLPPPPKPIGSYTTAVASGDLLFLSGTTCYVEGGLLYTGKVGDSVMLDQAIAAARQTALNLLAIARAELGTLNRVEQVVKLNAYVNSAPGFDQQPAVINGASDLLVAVFGERGIHARTSVGVSELPGQIPVEIEMVIRVRPARADEST